MVKAEAQTDKEKGGCNTSVQVEGTGRDIINEILCIIETLMKDLKDTDEVLHAIALQAIADNPEILTGEDAELVEVKSVRIAKGLN